MAFLSNLNSWRPSSMTLGVVFLGFIISSNSNAAYDVGSLPGSFSVTPSGAANYSLAIDLPPGISGLQPNIGVTYDSQAGNGLLGMGWSISGLSQITRCAKTLADDGFIHGVDYTAEDAFCLDGQRLVNTEGNIYRPRLGNSVYAVYSNNAFKVYGKGGSVTEYGVSVDSNVKAQGQSVTRVWAVNKVSDNFDNSYTYTYQVDAANGAYRIVSINYAANTASINFEYEDRLDTINGYQAGSAYKTVKRLSNIVVNHTSSSLPVSSYSLVYHDDNASYNPSHLVSIQKCNGSKCLPPTRFDWDARKQGFNAVETAVSSANSSGQILYSYDGKAGTLIDVTGDGIVDRVWTPDGSTEVWVAKAVVDNRFGVVRFAAAKRWLAANAGGVNNASWGQLRQTYVDVDADGLTDRVWVPNGVTEVWVAKSTGSSFATPERWISNLEQNRWIISSEAWHESYQDVNGDGRADRIWVPDGTYEVWVALSDGNDFITPQLWLSRAETGVNVNSYGGWNILYGDVNGDGMTDRVWMPNGTREWRVAISTGTGFKAPVVWASDADSPVTVYSWNGQTKSLTDVNGDGLPDLVWRPDGRSDVWVALSTGVSFAYPKLWLAQDTGGVNAYSWSGQTESYYDVNADGLSDKVWVPDGVYDLWVALSDGEKFNTPQKFLTMSGEKLTSTNGWRNNIGDINGDGSLDRVWLPSGVSAHFNQSISVAMTERISAITDAMGNVRTIEYKPLTDPNVYRKGTGATYPEQDIQYAQYVVSSQLTTDGLNGTTRIMYEYEGARVSLQGRGQLGFAKTTATNLQTNFVTTVTYNQAYPFTGMVETETQRLNEKTLAYTENEPAVFALGDGREKVYLSSVVGESYDANGALLSTVTTLNDVAGNLNGDISTVQVTTQNDNDLSDVFTTYTTSTYDYEGSSDFNLQSLVTSTSVRKTGPQGDSPTVVQNFEYDLQNYKLLSESGSVNGIGGIKKSYGYTDSFGHINSTTISAADIETRIVTTEYDAIGQFATKVTNEMGHSVTTTYDPVFGVPLTETDANGLVSSYNYDVWGRIADVYAPGGNATHTTRSWCQFGCELPVVSSNAVSQTAKFVTVTSVSGGGAGEKYAPDVVVYYDALGREVRKQTTNFKGATVNVDTAYDDLGRIVAQTQPYFEGQDNKNATVTTYDVLNRVRRSAIPNEGFTTVTYNDAAFEVITNKAAYNPAVGAYETYVQVEKKNVIGQVLSNADNNGNVLYYEYDAQGNKVKTLLPSVSEDGSTVVNPKGTVVEVQYDVFGRKTRMIDPDMGSWSYSYDSTSKLRSQTDGTGKTTTMLYDRLGRMVQRDDADGRKTFWVYNDDLVKENAPNTMAIGKLDSVYQVGSTGQEEYRQLILYTADLGLEERRISIIEEGNAAQSKKVSYATELKYDQFNRPEIVSYPETSPNKRLQLKYVYKNGALTDVLNTDGLRSYWQAQEINARGQITLAYYGFSRAKPSGVVTQSKDYDAAGRLIFLDYGNELSALYSATYQYNDNGSLIFRESLRNNTLDALTEEYRYDTLQRLVRVDINDNVGAQVYSYDVLGNIRSKTGQGAYQYANGKPHAVSQVNGATYTYNNNGAITQGGGRSIDWSSFNKPAKISNTGGYSSFDYGPSRARYRQFSREYATASQSQNDMTTIYVGGSYEKVSLNGKTEHKHYIKVSGKTIAQYTVTQTSATDVGTTKLEYLLRDNQGSTVTVVSADGAVTAQMDYDAFGSRRPILGANTLTSVIQSIPRGYTGHEHLTKLGLIHMNGRVYDPKLGRFLSADPVIQFEKNIQSYNRFSYVLNNPMSYTDPSGFSLRRLVRSVAKVATVGMVLGTPGILAPALLYSKPVKRVFLKYQWARTGLQAASTFCGPAAAACAAASAAYLTNISGGSLGDAAKAAAISYATASAYKGIGDGAEAVKASTGAQLSVLSKTVKVLAHGAVGWLSSKARGGNGKDGLIGAAFSQGLSQFGGYTLMGITPDTHVAVQAAAAVVVGGVISKAAGGQFEGGAISALYGLMFNEIQHGSNHNLKKGDALGSDDAIRDAVFDARSKVLKQCGDDCEITRVIKGPFSSADAAASNGADHAFSGILTIVDTFFSKTPYKIPSQYATFGLGLYLKLNSVQNKPGDVVITVYGTNKNRLYLNQVVVRGDN